MISTFKVIYYNKTFEAGVQKYIDLILISFYKASELAWQVALKKQKIFRTIS